MPFIKVTGKGWKGFTGFLGTSEFKDGVSVKELSDMEARRICSFMYAEVVDPKAPKPQPVTTPKAKSQTPKAKPPKPETKLSFTRKELEKVADEGGVKGIRDFAEPFGVRGSNIVEIIETLMAKKSEVEKPKATPE